MKARQEYLIQFKHNNIWDLVPCPKDKIEIDTRWVFRNKLDEKDIITRNKSRLVEKGYNVVEEIDYAILQPHPW